MTGETAVVYYNDKYTLILLISADFLIFKLHGNQRKTERLHSHGYR
jgi:hypothetical protein